MTFHWTSWRMIAALLAPIALGACPKDDPGASDGGTTSAEPDPDSGSSTPTSGASDDPCQGPCEHLFACGDDLLAPSVAACISLCHSSALIDTEWCHSAARDWYACLGDAPCEDIAPGPVGACAVPFADYTISCVPCSAAIEPDTAERCFATDECGDGLAVTFACDGDTCSCILDGDTFASCPAAGACASDDAAIQAAAEACCEMPFTPAKPLG